MAPVMAPSPRGLSLKATGGAEGAVTAGDWGSTGDCPSKATGENRCCR